MHAAEGRIARSSEVRFIDAVESVRIGYLAARDKKALREWDRWRQKGSKGVRRQVGLTGEALERAMSGILLVHPEFQKGVPRPRHLQPRSLWAVEPLGKQAKPGKRARKGAA